jgi:ribosomal-protein-alanine N-acetyltransferase
MTVRYCNPADTNAIAAVQSASPEAADWNPRDYLAYDTLVAELDGRIAAFLASREVASGERELLNLAVHPEFRRQGIASVLLRNALSAAHPAEWFLEVRASNHAAIAFYEKHAFQRAGIRPKYYREPSEDAVVMRKSS